MNLDKRALLGPLFAPLSAAKHSPASRIFSASLHLPSQLLRARRNRPFFAVDFSSSQGLGATIAEGLLICQYAESRGLVPRVMSTNRLYAHREGEDYLQHYLGPDAPLPDRPLVPMRPGYWSLHHLGIDQRLSIDAASRLFWRHFAPRDVVSRKVDAVLAQVPGRRFDLAVHYRGTDKAFEAPRLAFDAYDTAMVDHAEAGGSLQRVFLATDEPGFEAFIRSSFPETTFTTYNLAAPADSSRGRHFSDMSAEAKATEALVNMFLLAAAPLCIRGASYLSAISKIIDPSLRTRTLNLTHYGSPGFPEREIIEAEAAEPQRIVRR